MEHKLRLLRFDLAAGQLAEEAEKLLVFYQEHPEMIDKEKREAASTMLTSFAK